MLKKLLASILLCTMIVTISASAISAGTTSASGPSTGTTSSGPSPASETAPSASSAKGLRDLTISAVIAGTPSFIQASEANIPLIVTITNPGDSIGTKFKLSVDVIDSAGRSVKPFTVPGSLDRWYPWKTGLDSGASYGFSGTLYVGISGGPSLHGQTITIIPRVDSCSGEEFMPDYCRVWENNEANNEFSKSTTLP